MENSLEPPQEMEERPTKPKIKFSLNFNLRKAVSFENKPRGWIHSKWNKVKQFIGTSRTDNSINSRNGPSETNLSQNPSAQADVLQNDSHIQCKEYWANVDAFEDPTIMPQTTLKTRQAGACLNRIRTGIARCNDNMYNWGYIDDPSCDCGFPKQTVQHIVEDCPLRRFHGGIEELHKFTPEAREWLMNLDIDL